MRCVLPFLLLLACGCDELVSSHVKMLNVVQSGAVSVMDRMTDSDNANSQFQVSGLAQNPGVTVEAAIVYRATAYFDGVAGQFQAGAFGTMGQPGNIGSEAAAILRSTDLSQERKLELLERLLTEPEPMTPE